MPNLTDNPSDPPIADHFVVGDEIARGGMGRILEAQDTTLGRKVAMKRIRSDRDADDVNRRRFVREASILARLEHPNIVPIHELGRETDGRLFYVMKRVDGRTLQAILDDLNSEDSATVAEYSLDRLLTVFVKVCDAISFAHSRGIIHRDLKPDNVMVGAFGEVQVMDWGLAKQPKEEDEILDSLFNQPTEQDDRPVFDDLFGDLADDSSYGTVPPVSPPTNAEMTLTLDGAVIGSPRFMSPEQAEGRIGDIDERSDIFALGAMLYSILTLRPPFTGSSVAEVLEQVKSGGVVPPTEIASGGEDQTAAEGRSPGDFGHIPSGRVPAALSAITLRAMQARAEDRYQTVPDLSADLMSYQGGFATSAENLGPGGHLILLVKRHRSLAIASLVGLLLLATISAGFMVTLMRSERRAVGHAADANIQRGKAEQEKSKALQALGEARLALAEAAYVSNDAEAMVRELQEYPEALRTTNSTWRYLWNQREALIGDLGYDLPDQEGTTLFVPGKPGWLAVAKPGAVHYLDMLDGSLKQTIPTGVTNACLAFSGDGRFLAASSSGSRLVTFFDARGGNPRGYIRIPHGADKLALNRDGSLVGVSLMARPDAAMDRVEIYERAEGKMIRQIEANDRHTIAFHPEGQLIAVGAFGNCLTLFRREEVAPILEDRSKRITSLEFSPDGRVLALATFDGYLRLLDPNTGRQINSTKMFRTGVGRMVWASSDHLVTHAPSRNGDWLTQIWAVDGLIPVKTFFGAVQKSGPTASQESPEWIFDRQSGYLISAGAPAGISRMPLGQEHHVLPVETGDSSLTGYIRLAVALANENLVLASGRPLMTLHDISQEPRRLEFASIRKGAIVAVHHGRGLIAQAGRYPRSPAPLRLFALRNGVPEPLFDAPLDTGMADLSFDHSGDRLLLFLRDRNALQVRSTSNGALLSEIHTPDRQLASHAAFVGDGRKLVVAMDHPVSAGGQGVSVLKLDWKTGQALEGFAVEQRVTALAVSPDGASVAIGVADGSVRFHQTQGLEFESEMRVHDDGVSLLAFHPSQPHIATASTDLSVKIWNHETGGLLNHYLGLSSRPNDMAFSPSGDLLAVVDNGERVRIWKPEETRIAAKLSTRAPVGR